MCLCMYAWEKEILEGNDFLYGLCDTLHFPNMVACIHTHTHTHPHTHTHTLPRRGWVYVPHNPLNLGRGLWQFWPIDNGANDILWLPRLGCKENATPGPWEPRLCAVKMLKLAHLEGPRRRAEFPQLMSIITDQTCERARLQRSWDPQDCGAVASCPWNSDPRNLRAWKMIALDLLAAMKHWPDLWNFLGFLEAIGPPKSCLNSSMLGHEGVSQVHRKKKKKGEKVEYNR